MTVSRLAAQERQLEEAYNDVRQLRQEHERFFVNAKADPEKVERLTKHIEETLPMLKRNGKPPKMWERLVHIHIDQQINSQDKAILPTEWAEAIKNIYDDINPKIKRRTLHKTSGWVRAMFGTANKYGFQIKSIDEGKIKGYFMIVKDEDRKRYQERLGFRVEKDLTAIDKFELQSKDIKRVQAQPEPLLIATGNRIETQTSEANEQEEKEEESESKEQENENE